MPGPFTHIYAERRLADFLTQDVNAGGVNPSFVRNADGNLISGSIPDCLTASPQRRQPASCRTGPNSPRSVRLGRISLSSCRIVANPAIPCDEIMSALSLLYWLGDEGRIDE